MGRLPPLENEPTNIHLCFPQIWWSCSSEHRYTIASLGRIGDTPWTKLSHQYQINYPPWLLTTLLVWSPRPYHFWLFAINHFLFLTLTILTNASATATGNSASQLLLSIRAASKATSFAGTAVAFRTISSVSPCCENRSESHGFVHSHGGTYEPSNSSCYWQGNHQF